MSSRRAYKNTRLIRAFNNKKIYLYKDNKVILLVSFKKGIYVINYITPKSYKVVFSIVKLPNSTKEIDFTTKQDILVDVDISPLRGVLASLS